MLRRFVLLGVLAACAQAVPSEEASGTAAAPLKMEKVAPLTHVYVKDKGALDIEADYLPQVVCCENGAAHPEAIKAQAVMARTYAFFKYYGENVGTEAKPLSGTTADQAYFCKQPVSDVCRQAVAATRGEITSYTAESGERFANVAFYIDGPRPACIAEKSCSCPKPSPATPMTPDDHPADCACFTFASQGAANPAYVTYNWALSGEAVVGSRIGNPSNESNRGCGSQNIQSCLGYAGWSYVDMLRMFYGQDIEVTALGGTAPPVNVPPPAPGRDAGGAADELETFDQGCTASSRRRGGAGLGLALAAGAVIAGVVRRRAPKARR